MPPIIERRGGNHRHAAPGGEKRPDRPTESPDFYGRGLDRRITRKSGGENQIRAGDRGENSAELNQEMRGRPERVAPDGHVPGDVPVQAETDRGNRDDA